MDFWEFEWTRVSVPVCVCVCVWGTRAGGPGSDVAWWLTATGLKSFTQTHCLLRCIVWNAKTTAIKHPQCVFTVSHTSQRGPVLYNFICICQRCHHALLNFTRTVLQLCWPWLHYKSTSFESKPPDCISQDVRVKLLHLDCNTELTVSLLLLGGLRDIYTSQIANHHSKILSLRPPAKYISADVSICLRICNHFQTNYEKQAVNSSFCLTLNQFRPIGPPLYIIPSHSPLGFSSADIC